MSTIERLVEVDGDKPGTWTVSNGVDNLSGALIFSSDGGPTHTVPRPRCSTHRKPLADGLGGYAVRLATE